jgi:hypothetical protein
MIHDQHQPERTIEDAYDWWYHRPNGELTCTDGSEREYQKSISKN